MLFFILIGLNLLFVCAILTSSIRDKRIIPTVAQQNKALIAAHKINKIILEELDYEMVTQKIADYIPSELDFATGVLAIYEPENQVIRRIAASNTQEAVKAINTIIHEFHIQFNEIAIPLSDPSNLMAKALREHTEFTTTDVYDVLGPVLTHEQSMMIQHIMQTNTTLVYPIYMENKPIGVFVASTSKKLEELTPEDFDIIKTFVDGSAIALQHSTLYRDLGKRSDELRLANSRLQELDHMKDEFVSLASHELRTPMTAIKSYLWMALNGKGGPLSEKMQRYLDIAYKSTERLIALVNDMLNVSRIESGRIILDKQVGHLDQLTQSILDEVMPRANELGLHLTIAPHDVLPDVLMDQNKMKEVIMNIVGNSLKFTPAGGSITISFSKESSSIRVQIADTGRGILPEDMPKLFQKFGLIEGSYMPNQVSQGTGLGLYITKSIIEMHGGKIWVESAGRDKGTIFSFTIPIAEGQTKSVSSDVQAPTQVSVTSQDTSSLHLPSPQG